MKFKWHSSKIFCGGTFCLICRNHCEQPKKRKIKVTTQIRDQLKIGRTTIDNSILCTLLCCQQLSLSISLSLSRSWWLYSLSMMHLVFICIKWIYCVQIDCAVWLAVHFSLSLSLALCRHAELSFCMCFVFFRCVFFSLCSKRQLPHCQNYTIIYLANGIFLFQMRWCKLGAHQNIHSINSFSEFFSSASISTFWHCICWAQMYVFVEICISSFATELIWHVFNQKCINDDKLICSYTSVKYPMKGRCVSCRK